MKSFSTKIETKENEGIMSGPSTDLFMLEWNDHSKTFLQTLRSLQTAPHLTDAHLACRGKLLPVHKFVLATCSDYFREIFSSINSGAVVVALQDVELDVLEALITFMYVGKVSVKQDKLAQLIHAAECFRIKGLAGREGELVSEFCSSAKTLTQDDDLKLLPKKRDRKRRRSVNDHVFDSDVQLKKHFRRVESTRLGSVADLLLAEKFMESNKVPRSACVSSNDRGDILEKRLKTAVFNKSTDFAPNVFSLHNVKEEEILVDESDMDSTDFITGLVNSKFEGETFSTPRPDAPGLKYPPGPEYGPRSDSPAIALNLSTSNSSSRLAPGGREDVAPPRVKSSNFVSLSKSATAGARAADRCEGDEAAVGLDGAPASSHHETRPDDISRVNHTPLTEAQGVVADRESFADNLHQQREEDIEPRRPATPPENFTAPPTATNEEAIAASPPKLGEKSDNSGDSGTHSQSSVRGVDDIDSHAPALAGEMDDQGVKADSSFSGPVDCAIPMLSQSKARLEEGTHVTVPRRLSESINVAFRRSHDEISYDSCHDEGRFNSTRDEENEHETSRAGRGSEGRDAEDGGFNDGSHDEDFRDHEDGDLNWRRNDGGAVAENRGAGVLEMFNCKVDGIDCVCIDRLTDVLVEHHFSSDDAPAIGPNLLYVSSRQCPICSYHTKTPAKFSRHVWQHKRLRTLCCTLCNYRTVLRPSFVVHLRQHTGEKPFKCTYCDYSASQKGNLFVHMKKHQVS